MGFISISLEIEIATLSNDGKAIVVAAHVTVIITATGSNRNSYKIPVGTRNLGAHEHIPLGDYVM
jgi:hypothetical protein